MLESTITSSSWRHPNPKKEADVSASIGTDASNIVAASSSSPPANNAAGSKLYAHEVNGEDPSTISEGLSYVSGVTPLNKVT